MAVMLNTLNTPPVAARMHTVQTSPILAMAAAAQALKAEGKPVISLSIGVPGFLPPAHVHEAAHTAIAADRGDYLPGRGSPALVEAWRTALAEKGFHYKATEVITQMGGKGALFNMFMALLNVGDEVIIPAPYWTSYPEMVRLAGGVPVMPLAPAQKNYKLTAAQLQAALTPRTRMVVFNNPSNPTGMLYSAAETAEIANVLAAHPHLWVVSDDIYDHLVYSADAAESEALRAPHVLDTHQSLRERTVIIQSVSKTYGMPGWRVGMAAGPEPLIDAMLTLSSQSHTHVPAVTMAAAAAALTGPQDFLQVQRARLHRQRGLVLGALSAMGWPCPVPQGAFYVFPDITQLLGKVSAHGTPLTSDVVLANALLHEAWVATVPGSAFGCPTSVRLSYAGPEAELAEAMARIAQWAAKLH